MAYSPSLGLAGTVSLVVDTLAAIPSVIALCAPASPRARIVVGDGGLTAGQFQAVDESKQALAPPLMRVHVDQADDTLAGIGSVREDLAIVIDLLLPHQSGDTAGDAYLRALDRVEGVMAGLRAAANAGTLIGLRFRLAEPPMMAPATAPAAFRGAWHASIRTESTRGIP